MAALACKFCLPISVQKDGENLSLALSYEVILREGHYGRRYHQRANS